MTCYHIGLFIVLCTYVKDEDNNVKGLTKDNNIKIISLYRGYQMSSGDVVEWLTCQTSNLRIASRMGSNPVRDKPLFP